MGIFSKHELEYKFDIYLDPFTAAVKRLETVSRQAVDPRGSAYRNLDARKLGDAIGSCADDLDTDISTYYSHRSSEAPTLALLDFSKRLVDELRQAASRARSQSQISALLSDADELQANADFVQRLYAGLSNLHTTVDRHCSDFTFLALAESDEDLEYLSYFNGLNKARDYFFYRPSADSLGDYVQEAERLLSHESLRETYGDYSADERTLARVKEKLEAISTELVELQVREILAAGS